MNHSKRIPLLVPVLLFGSPLLAQTSSSQAGSAAPSGGASGPPATKAPAFAGPMNFMDVRYVNDNQGEVDAADIANGAVGTPQLGNASVTTAKIEDGAVNGSKLATGAVGVANLGNGVVTGVKIANGAVSSVSVADGSIFGIDIADGSITAADLGSDSVGSSEIAANAVGASEIAADAVGASEIAANAVGSSEVADNSLTANDLASNSVGADEIASNSVGPGEINKSGAFNWAFNVAGGYSNVDYRMELVEQDSFNHGLYLEFANDHSSTYVLSASKLNGDHEFWVTSEGDVYADGTFNGSQGIAQIIGSSEDGRDLEPGDVLAIDPSNPRSVHLARGARSTLVAGVYTEEAGMLASHRQFDRLLDEEPQMDHGAVALAAPRAESLTVGDFYELYREVPNATSGILQVKVSAENGAILPGDLLVTARTPGHAMRDANPAVGTVLGKALGSLASGTGLIEVLITLD